MGPDCGAFSSESHRVQTLKRCVAVFAPSLPFVKPPVSTKVTESQSGMNGSLSADLLNDTFFFFFLVVFSDVSIEMQDISQKCHHVVHEMACYDSTDMEPKYFWHVIREKSSPATAKICRITTFSLPPVQQGEKITYNQQRTISNCNYSFNGNWATESVVNDVNNREMRAAGFISTCKTLFSSLTLTVSECTWAVAEILARRVRPSW